MSSLKNKKIIISAGASGIGWATAKVCLDKGATVFICDIDEKYLSKAKKHKQNNKKLYEDPEMMAFAIKKAQKFLEPWKSG